MNKNTKMVVFDDDPTGIQTVHGCLLLTQWDDETLEKAFTDDVPFFYILTNTRAMTAADACQRMRDAVESVLRVNARHGYRLICVSRSDSCLRGHFPLETDIMRHTLESHGVKVWKKTPFAPAFIESGRVTIGGIHYMRDGDRLIPVSETEFARDNVFGYSTSCLRDYILEKGGNPDDYDIVDADSYTQLDEYRDRLFEATADWDGAVVIRSSSSLPRSISGIADKPLLSPADLMIPPGGCGTIIVGSHVKKTTEQLNHLLDMEGTAGIELPIDAILDNAEQLRHDVLMKMREMAAEGKTPVVYTSRKEVRIADAEKRQALGQKVSAFLVSLVSMMDYRPAYLVAKGGITSHDILTHGLNVSMARVMGQAINSVPCIMTEKDGHNLPYIIFPGNVGNASSLAEIYRKMSRMA